MKFLSFALFSFLVFSCGSTPQKTVIGTENPSIESEIDTTLKHDPGLQDVFRGSIRASVKTSFVNLPTDTFQSIKELRNWLPDDEYMHKSTEAKTNTAPRTKEENHSICLADVYIFGIKREDDNDFHVILGSSKSLEKSQPFLTAEISGLPDSTSPFFAILAAVRHHFKNWIGTDISKELVFVASKKNPPIHLDYISGSLFFDNHHYGAHSKVDSYKVFSAWEIHPVTKIVFHNKQRIE